MENGNDGHLGNETDKGKGGEKAIPATFGGHGAGGAGGDGGTPATYESLPRFGKNGDNGDSGAMVICFGNGIRYKHVQWESD